MTLTQLLQARRIDLLRLGHFPGKWVKTLDMKDFTGVRTVTFFNHCTECELEGEITVTCGYGERVLSSTKTGDIWKHEPNQQTLF